MWGVGTRAAVMPTTVTKSGAALRCALSVSVCETISAAKVAEPPYFHQHAVGQLQLAVLEARAWLA